MDTKFYVELPADEYGNTAMNMAVVEATVVTEGGKEKLVPIAPDNFVAAWPQGWFRNTFGGWVETEGPARHLSFAEHAELVASLSEEVKSCQGNIVTLKNGEQVPGIAVSSVMVGLRSLIEELPIVFYEAVMLARDPQHSLFGTSGDHLKERGLIDSSGHMHDLVRAVVVSAVEGEELEMVLGSPVAQAA